MLVFPADPSTGAGNTYERSWILRALEQRPHQDPLTGGTFTGAAMLVPNNELKRLISDWKAEYHRDTIVIKRLELTQKAASGLRGFLRYIQGDIVLVVGLACVAAGALLATRSRRA